MVEAYLASASLRQWHERLRHVNIEALKRLFSKYIVEDIKLTDSKSFFCETCVYAKQHKLKFASKPKSEPSIGGSRYLQRRQFGLQRS